MDEIKTNRDQEVEDVTRLFMEFKMFLKEGRGMEIQLGERLNEIIANIRSGAYEDSRLSAIDFAPRGRQIA